MWFKNAQIFQLTEPFGHGRDELAMALSSHPARPCGPAEALTIGWRSPIEHLDAGAPLVYEAADCYLLCLHQEEKLLPPSVLDDFLKERIQKIQDEESRTIGRKERKQIKEDLYIELLPRAFTIGSRTYGYIDLVAGQIIVNVSSLSKAEDFVSHLRRAMGSLPARPLRVQGSAEFDMTRWLGGADMPEGFALADQCELRQEDAVVTYRGESLADSSQEIATHLDAGKVAAQVGLTWEGGRITCTLTAQPALKGIRYGNDVQQRDDPAEDPAEQFDADFTLMVLELRRLIGAVVAALSGSRED